MKCEKCLKNTATTHIKRVVNGVATEKYLCSGCAAQQGYASLSNNSFANMLASVFGDTTAAYRQETAKHCSGCNYTFSDIVSTGRVGCEHCYTEFSDELLPYLKRVHGSVNHIGKVPNFAPLAVVDTKSEIDSLRTKLAEHIKNEEFELAATVRDKIRELEKEEN